MFTFEARHRAILNSMSALDFLAEWFETVYAWCVNHVPFLTVSAAFLGYIWKQHKARQKKGVGLFTVFKQFAQILQTLNLLGEKIDENSKINREFSELKFNELKSENYFIKAQLELLEVTSDIPIWKANKNGQCIFVNDSYCDLFAKDEGELLGDGWLNTIAREDLDTYLKLWSKAIAAETASNIEFLANTKYGIRKCRASFTVCKGDGFTQFQGTTQLVEREN
jgi:PAS domain-containing protein